MEKRMGTGAGLLALLALVVHTVHLPTAERPSGSAGPTHRSEASSEKGPDQPNEENLSPKPPKGPWLATQQYFHRLAGLKTSSCITYLISPDPDKEPGARHGCQNSDLPTLFGFAKDFNFSSNVTGLIATIQDPFHTRMSLAADRTLNSIQQAAYASGWEFATQWLPWNVKTSGRADESSTEQSSECELSKETMPGLIVFRRHFIRSDQDRDIGEVLDKLLLVFVVGETPTAGINGFQFEAARHCLLAFQSRTNRISVLGPNFSGSFASLAKLIESDTDTSRAYDVRSGSVSNEAYAQSMLHYLRQPDQNVQQPDPKRRKPHPNVTFHGETLPSQEITSLFNGQVLPDLGYSNLQAAELVEDESGFSVSFIPPSGPKRTGPVPDQLTFRYPRDIAQLRNAYSDVAFAPGGKPEATPTSALDFSLKDTQSGEDSFPIFSQTHTPVSQNAVLEQIVRELNRKRIRIVRLDATNVFDTLFLAKVLKKYCPDIRVIVSGADSLFVQEAADSSLTGLLAISTYPMFSQGREWANPNEHDITTFADADSVGEYNACVSLL